MSILPLSFGTNSSKSAPLILALSITARSVGEYDLVTSSFATFVNSSLLTSLSLTRTKIEFSLTEFASMPNLSAFSFKVSRYLVSPLPLAFFDY